MKTHMLAPLCDLKEIRVGLFFDGLLLGRRSNELFLLIMFIYMSELVNLSEEAFVYWLNRHKFNQGIILFKTFFLFCYHKFLHA